MSEKDPNEFARPEASASALGSGNRLTDEREELRKFYADRYRRIKDERKVLLNTLIGLSGGAIVLSITFLDKIAPNKHLKGCVIAAWCLFGLTVLVSIVGLVRMIWRSQQYQRKLDYVFTHHESAPEDSGSYELDEEGHPQQ